MQPQEQTNAFETDMKAILAGEKEAPNKTLAHFAARFNKAREEQDKMTQELQKLDQQISQGKTEFAKLTGFIEGLAVDLRHLWEEANQAPAPAKQPEIVATN